MQKSEDIEKRLQQLENEIKMIRRAFVVNEFGDPDYYGHNDAHKKDMRRSREVDGLKMDATKWIVYGILSLAFGALGMGITTWLQKVAG